MSKPTRTTRTRGVGGRFTSLVPSHERFCAACKTTTTSQWRTGAEDGRSLCNRCGIRLRRRAESSRSRINKDSHSHSGVLPSMSAFIADVLPVEADVPDNMDHSSQVRHRRLPGIHTLMPSTRRPHQHSHIHRHQNSQYSGHGYQPNHPRSRDV